MRNAEVIRQWTLLRTLEAARHGATVKTLARDLKVTTRTIWRDMEALQAVGFPLYSDKDGRETRWRLSDPPFRGLGEIGISVVELASLYMGRAMVEGMAGAPFGAALAGICRKLEKVLPTKMREFLDQLPGLIQAKPTPAKKPGTKAYETHLAALIQASLDRRVCTMRYFSASKQRAKDYLVHPYQLVHAEGGMYLLAWVPEYGEVRTFAVERIQKINAQAQRFEMSAEFSGEAFGHSLGVNRGKPEKIVISFSPRVSGYVRERTWHKSQRLETLPDQGLRITLNVCCDYALRAWVLSFGPFAKVESPSRFAEQILEQLEEAREAYAPRFDFAVPRRLFSLDHPRLPGLDRARPS
jgi:predicted DNA-binding transcriptional regulator YafY